MPPVIQPVDANGPFRNIDVNIYCDESRHEGQKGQRFMVIGGLWLPRSRRHEIITGVQAIRAKHTLNGELKWTKLSRKCLPAYEEIAAYVANQPDIHFRCIVVDKTQVKNDVYFQNDKQLGFWVFYWHCLKQWLGHGNTYFISIDFKPESLRSGPKRLKHHLERSCLGRAWIKSLDCVDSNENVFCQIADLFIGAVGYQHNGLTGSAYKMKFCESLSRDFHRQDLLHGDVPSFPRFNVFKIWS